MTRKIDRVNEPMPQRRPPIDAHRERRRALATARSRVAAWIAGALLVAVGCSGPGNAARPGSPGSPAASATGSASMRAAAATAVLDADFPDPDLLRVGGTWFAYATQPADGSVNVQVARSTDLKSWKAAAADPLPRLPAWATTGRTWAPDVSKVGDGYVMYVTAHSVDPDLQCIGVARAASPLGPFRPVGSRPLVCPKDEGGAIDPASFLDSDGRRYLLWKNDGNCCGKDTWLQLSPVSADGLRITGPARRLVRQDQTWEGQLVEAPTLVRHGDSYVLFYSANDYGGGSYATGYAIASRIEGPFRKAQEPLLTTAGVGVTGPGGQDVVTARDGSTRIVFHGWDPAVIYRGMYVATLTWAGNRPRVGS